MRTWSASCARLIGVPCGGGSSRPLATEHDDDWLRLLLTPLAVDGAALTVLVSGTASKHCHAAAHTRSACTGGTAARLIADFGASVLLRAEAAAAAAAEGFISKGDDTVSAGPQLLSMRRASLGATVLASSHSLKLAARSSLTKSCLWMHSQPRAED